MVKNFFEKWQGDFHNPFAKNEWVKAEGSSLKEPELQVLKNGGIVVHPKCENAVKVFARDKNLWSIIIPENRLNHLKKDLGLAGFSVD